MTKKVEEGVFRLVKGIQHFTFHIKEDNAFIVACPPTEEGEHIEMDRGLARSFYSHLLKEGFIKQER